MHFLENTHGRDFVVGDIHGCFTKLQAALDEIEFDEANDRLFSVGDLVDRGPESHEMLDWLGKPWFWAIRGNHDQMLIDYYKGLLVDKSIYDYNGGSWFMKLKPEEQVMYAMAAEGLPLWAEIDTPNGLVGLVHCDAPADWSNIAAFHEHWLLWGRQRIMRKVKAEVKNVWRVYCGHTPVKQKEIYGNVHYIDTGAVFGREFHIERIN